MTISRTDDTDTCERLGHSWPDDLGHLNAECLTCHLRYAEWTDSSTWLS